MRQYRAVLLMHTPARVRRELPLQAKACQHAGAGGGCAGRCAALHTAEPCGHAADADAAPQCAAGPILAHGGQRGGASGAASCRTARSHCHPAAGRAEPRPCGVNASRCEEAVCCRWLICKAPELCPHMLLHTFPGTLSAKSPVVTSIKQRSRATSMQCCNQIQQYVLARYLSCSTLAPKSNPHRLYRTAKELCSRVWPELHAGLQSCLG